MNNPRQAPLFCDNCSSLAMAELDDMLLCAECLLLAVSSTRDKQLTARIKPLRLFTLPSPRNLRTVDAAAIAV